MDLLHWIFLTGAIIAWILVDREKARDVPVVVWCFLVSSALIGFVVRGRRNTSGPSAVKEDVLEVNDSLIELHRPSGTPSVQVLFFHGLPFEKSSRVHLTTWECGDGSDNLWPQTWLVEEFPGAHVFVVRYCQGLSEDSRKTFDMKNVVENLLSDLMQGEIGQVQGCPVVLVGHSVGGLVIKRLCLEAHETFSLRRNSRNDRVQVNNFLNRLSGIFYYGTPHHGIPDIVKAADLLDSPLFKYFHTLSTDAARLNSNFSHLCIRNSKWQIKGLAENLPVKSGVFRGIVVVPEAAAREGELNVDTADHFSISKPPSKKSRRFNAVTRLLHNVMENAKDDACPRNWQYVPDQLQGIDSSLQEVRERLKTVRSLCLTGMGGSGKTTLAKVLFNELAPKFEYTCFLSDVKLIKGNEEALKEEVWKRMYHNGKKVERENDLDVRGRELLLVLDDISTDRDKNVLAEIANGSSLESRFLATSRDHRLLHNTHEVLLLNADSAQQLFVSRAFPNQVTPDNLVSLVEQIVKKCEGLPLALEVLGQYLRGRREEEDWKQALDALGKAEAVAGFNESLWEKLRLSYNGLEENEQQIFLDATTFFSSGGWTLRHAKIVWRETYHVSENLVWRSLVERSLVYDVKEDEVIEVHEQLRNLGQKIAAESNVKCRVWEWPKALELLQSSNESEKQNIHSLWSLELLRSGEEIHVSGRNLEQLKNLRYFQARPRLVIEANRDDKWFPRNLVLLDCVGLQLFDPARQRCLVILELTNIEAEFLPNGIGLLSRLRIFRLHDAPKLRSLPDDIGQLSQLETLLLYHCPRLETLPETFGELSNLKVLGFWNCPRLRRLPESFGNLITLSDLSLERCTNLHSLPESFGKLSTLSHLTLWRCTNLHSLPESFGELSTLSDLSLYCTNLHSLPESFGNLIALSHLSLGEFVNLHSLPESFGKLITLSELSLEGCTNLHSLPESFGKLSTLSHLTLRRCTNLHSLPDSFGKLITLSRLTLYSCTNLHSLPESFGQLAQLEYLNISDAYELERLPASLAALKGLRHLFIACTSITSIPEYVRTLLSLQTLELQQLPYVKELPPWLGETGPNSVACSGKVFQVREQNFSLIGDKIRRESDLVRHVHARFMGKVSKSDYTGALAALSVRNLGEPVHQGLVLQEKGIVKRRMGDLPGALQDLTAALEIFSKIEDGDCYIYDCWKHRGYVNFLMENEQSAVEDGTMALKLQLEYRKKKMGYLSATLGEEQVTYMHFKLEGWKEMFEHGELMGSLHDRVVQQVMAPGTAEGDFRTALARFDMINLRVLPSYKRAFFLQERGILKRMAGDLGGALEDLTTALEMLRDDYDCRKHRGFVKYLLGDIEGAQTDAERALTFIRVVGGPEYLGGTPVTYLEFQL